jgi:hypothetical protein
MRVPSVRHIVMFFMSALVGGCVIESNGGTPAANPDPVTPGVIAEPDNATTRGHLAHARTLVVQPGGQARLTATRLWGEDYVVDAVVPFQGGKISVQAQPDGRITIVSAELSVGDIHMSNESVPPNGLDLTQIFLRLPYVTADATWTADGSAALAKTQAELVLDWSLESKPGEIHPMATQHIREVPITLDVVADNDGRLVASLSATRPGIFFTWTGLFALSDLELTVDALE